MATPSALVRFFGDRSQKARVFYVRAPKWGLQTLPGDDHPLATLPLLARLRRAGVTAVGIAVVAPGAGVAEFAIDELLEV